MAVRRSVWIVLFLTASTLNAAGCRALEGLLPASPQASAPGTTDQSTAEPTPAPLDAAPSAEEPTPITTEVTECQALDADLLAQMNEIEEQVITLRGLQPLGPVDRSLLTQEELQLRIREDFVAEYSQEEAQDDAHTWELLGLLEPDFDLWSFYVDLYSEQVAGFYDDADKEMALICERQFSGPVRITYGHEYTHALQDQVFDFENGLGYSDEICETTNDRCSAIRALVEGDATLLEEQWWQIYATKEDLADLVEMFESFETPVLNSAPRFIREDLLFPYKAGLTFVNALYRDGGWAAVDAAYAEPPLSTEQILHNEKYPNETPVLLAALDIVSTLGESWREIDRDVLGEWFTQLVLNEYLPRAEAVQAAEGWGGDYYLAYYSDALGLGALVLVTQWDTMRDVHEFAAAFLNYGDARLGKRVSSSTYESRWENDSSYSYFERRSNQTRWIMAPDAETVELLRQAQPFPAKQQ